MKLRTWLAEWLCPQMARDAKRYFYLRDQCSTVHRWCDGEAAMVATYLMEQDADHWRALGERIERETPHEIMKFRQTLRDKREAR